MSKSQNITITNLTINIGGGAQRSSTMSDLLASMISSAIISPAEENGNTGEEPAEQAAQAVDTLKGDLVEFLQPDQYETRTLAAIQKAFSTRPLFEIKAALHELIEENVVFTKRRRSDGETLYGANVQAYVDVAPQPDVVATQTATGESLSMTEGTTAAQATPTLTVDALVDFLESDDRYSLRSESAIRKHFAGSSHADVSAVILMATSSDRVHKARRRSDGAALFGAN